MEITSYKVKILPPGVPENGASSYNGLVTIKEEGKPPVTVEVPCRPILTNRARTYRVLETGSLRATANPSNFKARSLAELRRLHIPA